MEAVLQVILDIFLNALVGRVAGNIAKDETVGGWANQLIAIIFGWFGVE